MGILPKFTSLLHLGMHVFTKELVFLEHSTLLLFPIYSDRNIHTLYCHYAVVFFMFLLFHYFDYQRGTHATVSNYHHQQPQ